MKSAPPHTQRPLHLLLAGAAVAVCSIGGLPAAKATGFLDFNNGNWTISSGGTNCPNGGQFVNCVDAGQSNLEMFGPEGESSSLTYTSAKVPANSLGYYITGFSYSFNDNAGFQKAYYRLAGTTVFLKDTGGNTTYESVMAKLVAEQDFEFGVQNDAGITGAAYLNVTQFTYEEAQVPAPLPLLGAAASFGWIRRRRSMLKAAASSRPGH